MLPWQQKHVLVTLLFEGIRTFSLVHIHFEATAIPDISVANGYNVTMATEACTCGIAV